MKFTARFTFSWLIVFCVSSLAQEPPDPDGPEHTLKAYAEGHKDSRGILQIKQDNALIRAAARGDLEGVHAALKEGALIDSRYIDGFAFLDEGRSGYTALMRASSGGHAEVVKLLIDSNANLELKRMGRTSLYMAVVAGRESVVKLLVNAGAKGDPKQMRLNQQVAVTREAFHEVISELSLVRDSISEDVKRLENAYIQARQNAAKTGDSKDEAIRADLERQRRNLDRLVLQLKRLQRLAEGR